MPGCIGKLNRIISWAKDIVPVDASSVCAIAAFGCKFQRAIALPSTGPDAPGQRSATVRARGAGVIEEFHAFGGMRPGTTLIGSGAPGCGRLTRIGGSLVGKRRKGFGSSGSASTGRVVFR